MSGRCSPRALAALLVVALVLLAAGCGVGAGRSATDVSVVVTQDFGARQLGDVAGSTHGEDTVMRLLERSFKVKTRFGGGFVQSINGLGGGRSGGRPVDWFYFVNGTLADKGAASVTVHGGDRIWWDRHDWGVTDRVPAVVGSFPEPFRHGSGGRRTPVRIDCAPGAETACDTVGKKLQGIGAIPARAALGATAGKETLRLLVGPWNLIRKDSPARQIEEGPAVSGVYAKPAADGRSIAVLDARGRVVKTLGAGAGLVAATRYEQQQPTWVVTGTDAAGVAQAAAALDEGTLGNHFALGITGDGVGVSLPVVGAP